MNFGTFYVPDSHPTPSAASSGFGVLSSWSVFGRSGRSSPTRRSLCLLRCSSIMNASLETGGGGRDSPPTRIIMTTALLGFWARDGVPLHALYKMCSRSVLAPSLSSGSRENHGPNEESGDGNRTVTQMLWTSVGQTQVVFLVCVAPISSRNPV